MLGPLGIALNALQRILDPVDDWDEERDALASPLRAGDWSFKWDHSKLQTKRLPA